MTYSTTKRISSGRYLVANYSGHQFDVVYVFDGENRGLWEVRYHNGRTISVEASKRDAIYTIENL